MPVAPRVRQADNRNGDLPDVWSEFFYFTLFFAAHTAIITPSTSKASAP